MPPTPPLTVSAKLNAVVRRESVSHSGDLPVVTELASAQYGLALGRSNVIHAASLAGPAGNTFSSVAKVSPGSAPRTARRHNRA